MPEPFSAEKRKQKDFQNFNNFRKNVSEKLNIDNSKPYLTSYSVITGNVTLLFFILVPPVKLSVLISIILLEQPGFGSLPKISFIRIQLKCYNACKSLKLPDSNQLLKCKRLMADLNQ